MLKNVKHRILDFLKAFLLEFAHPVNGWVYGKELLTHEEIARITTTSRQSVATSQVYFKKHGLIDYDIRNLQVYHSQHS